MGSETRQIIRARTFLRSQRTAVHFPRSKARQVHNVELGSRIRPSLGAAVSFPRGRSVRGCIRSSIAENAPNQRPTKADFSQLCLRLHFSRRTYFSVPSEFNNDLKSSMQINYILCLLQVLLANKLDGDSVLGYTIIAAPLLLSHMTLIFMSFGAKGGNRCMFF